ncbi:MAG: hypothetical protein E2O68_07905 [Deltaproteobacteria bacterium]|nr:MAG: hypothetical protein E2O68_07905 [Deltaproteobacteria bacterium]
MKLIPLLLLLPLYCFSAENLEILELDSGSCWIDETSSKIVSFGENKNFTIDERALFSITAEIEKKLKAYKVILPEKRKLYLYCNSTAAHLVLKFQGKGQGICAWASHNGKDLSLDFLGNYEGNTKGICEGAIPGELLVYGELPSFIDPVWDRYILLAGPRKIILTKSYYFKEDKVIKRLKEHFPGVKIERNYMIRQTGEYMELTTTEFGN